MHVFLLLEQHVSSLWRRYSNSVMFHVPPEDDWIPVRDAMRWPQPSMRSVPRLTCTLKCTKYDIVQLDSTWSTGTYDYEASFHQIKSEFASQLLPSYFSFKILSHSLSCFMLVARYGWNLNTSNFIYAMHDGQDLKHPLMSYWQYSYQVTYTTQLGWETNGRYSDLKFYNA